MEKVNNIMSLFVVFCFLILVWATSPARRYLEADAWIYQDSLVILVNKDDIDVREAILGIVSDTVSYTGYHIDHYELAAGARDTLPLSAFYPSNTPPVSISLWFLHDDGRKSRYYNFNKRFGT